jgi:hypothetical protein
MKLNDKFIQIKSNIEQLDKNIITTGFISLPQYNDLSYLEDSDSSEMNDMTYAHFGSALLNLSAGQVDHDLNLPSYDELIEKASKTEIEMTILNIEYNRIAKNQTQAFESFLANEDATSFNLKNFIAESDLIKENIFTCLPLNTKTLCGSKVTFIFKDTLLFDNTSNGIPIIRFDADDGVGYRTVELNETIQVSYSAKGKKNLRVEIQYADQLLKAKSNFIVIQTERLKPDYEFPLTAMKFYKNGFATGQVKLYYANKDKKIVKPLYFWTGFDTGTSSTAMLSTPLDLLETSSEELFAANYDSFLKIALDNGYDIVTIDWDNPRDYIQNNGYLAATLIHHINDAFPNAADGAIVTGSMGGLIARWATLFMENDKEEFFGAHQLKNIITLDTPHEGAVMPLAMQYAVDYIAFRACGRGEEAVKGRKVIQSPAANQMLVQQFTHRWKHQSEPKHHDERTILLKEFKKWGEYPKASGLKLYAVSNGSKNGLGQTNVKGTETLMPGGLLLSGELPGTLWIKHLKASPNFPKRSDIGHEVLDLHIVARAAWKATIHKSLPYDSCPGGHWDFISSIKNSLSKEAKMPFQNTCFIPTVSSVGIKTNNLYEKIDENKPGPFTAIFLPDHNERHASLTAANTKWILGKLGINL